MEKVKAWVSAHRSWAIVIAATVLILVVGISLGGCRLCVLGQCAAG